ncbi:hypothetical protein ACFLY8_00080 [Halobacteriota archaeon]
MKKRTDAELFRELRIISIIFGIAMIIVAVVTIFMESLGDYWYRLVLFFMGWLLISFSSQKYLQEYPKVRVVIMWILVALTLLAVLAFFMFMNS